MLMRNLPPTVDLASNYGGIKILSVESHTSHLSFFDESVGVSVMCCETGSLSVMELATEYEEMLGES